MKVRLQNEGEDVETPWAEDLGPAPGRPEHRLVQLGNVPFLHAKPTYEDVLEVAFVDGMYQWDAEGVPFERIGSRIAVDHGRWVVIIDYALRPGSDQDLGGAFRELDRTAEALDIALEGAFTTPDQRGGRAYLAISPALSTPIEVLERLAGASLHLELTLVHPL